MFFFWRRISANPCAAPFARAGVWWGAVQGVSIQTRRGVSDHCEEWWPRAESPPYRFCSALCAERNRWWPRAESNHRHTDFQSAALPTELLGHCPAHNNPDGAESQGIRLPFRWATTRILAPANLALRERLACTETSHEAACFQSAALPTELLGRVARYEAIAGESAAFYPKRTARIKAKARWIGPLRTRKRTQSWWMLRCRVSLMNRVPMTKLISAITIGYQSP
jgi:hypothetical protein